MAKILVVDDNATNRKLIVTLLGYEGHTVLEAADGEQALELARAGLPQLIISDLLMPTMDGFEFVQRLRADRDLAEIAVIFHTAHYLDHEAQKLAARCRVAHVLPKPCEGSKLLQVVAKILSTASAPDTLRIADDFDHEHLRLITNKLAQKVEELEREIDDRKQAQFRIQHLNRVYAVLGGINSLIVRVASRDELYRGACRIAVEQGRFRVAWIGVVDATAGQIVPYAWAGESDDLQQSVRALLTDSPPSEGLVATAVHSQLPQLCNDLEVFSGPVAYRNELLARGYRSLVALPLVIGKRCVGCLALASEEPNRFNEAEMQLLAELAGDISFALDHIEKAERLDYLAYYDSLTGLANRNLLLERLTQHVDLATHGKHEFALLVIDLDRFEAINETLGRHAGDQLLRQLAERLVSCVGNANEVARVGSDCFALVTLKVGADGAILRALENWWRQWLGPPFEVDGVELRLSAKAGIALYPADGADAETLLSSAEAALKKAKTSGSRHAFYTQHLSPRRLEWLALENKLRRALERQEFVLHYQPKVDLEARRVQGVEALIRWHNPELGLVPPGEFIPLLEETGLIGDVGAWVLRQACGDYSRWLRGNLPAPRIAVNVSTIQLRRDDFVRSVADVLAAAGGEVGIDIEVTESLLMEDIAENIEKLTAIRLLGVGISIDDFGTGYSSLGYLAKLPVESLKIDRSFVISMLDDPSAMTLVSTIISLAHALKLIVVAEGVESEETAKILRLLRCDQMQGYFISEPLAFDEMTTWLAKNHH